MLGGIFCSQLLAYLCGYVTLILIIEDQEGDTFPRYLTSGISLGGTHNLPLSPGMGGGTCNLENIVVCEKYRKIVYISA